MFSASVGQEYREQAHKDRVMSYSGGFSSLYPTDTRIPSVGVVFPLKWVNNRFGTIPLLLFLFSVFFSFFLSLFIIMITGLIGMNMFSTWRWS